MLKKIPAKKLYKSKGQGNKKEGYKTVSNQILHHVATSQLNCDKIQITGFRKTRGNRAGNLRTDSSNKVNKSELK